MPFNIDFSLQVEDPTGSNNWIHYPEGITRLTGESANYRIYYSFSATENGTFDNMSFEVAFPDAYRNLLSVSGVGLPAGASYTMERDNDRLWMKIVFAPSLPPGQSGFMEFFVNSSAPAGPNGFLITPTISLSGLFRDNAGIETPIDEVDLGATWTVECALYDTLTKRVTHNGSIYVEDSEAYIVEYQVERRLNPPVPGSYKGVWAAESCELTEYLPSIPMVTTEIVWSDRPYQRIGNRIIWDFSPAQTPSNGVRINFRLRYPKNQVDARGGPAAIGNIYNAVAADYELLGGVEEIVNAYVSHRLSPVPAPNPGSVEVSKTSDPRSIPGNVLGMQDIPVLFSLRAVEQNGNMIPSIVEITDLRLTIELADGTVYVPDSDEIVWKEIQINNNTVTFEYQTALGGSVWTPIAMSGYSRHTFPTITAGDYITAFRFSGSDFIHPGDSLFAYVWVTVKRRDLSLEHYRNITNEISAKITMSNGAEITGNAQAVLPVDYSQSIVTQIISTAVDSLTINPGGTAEVRTTLEIAEGTTTAVNGTDLFVVIPSGFTLTAVKDKAARQLAPTEYTVDPDWQMTGQSLLHVPIEYGAPSQARTNFIYSLTCDVDPLVIPVIHNFDFWYVINTEQATDPEIVHSAIGTTAPDIYDFDRDGDITELVAMQTLPVTVTSAHVINVIKMSKGPRDAGFEPDNDTHVTAGEMFQYQLNVRNDSPDPITDLVMIDIFPYLGDIYSSEWRPLLSAPITPPPGVDIKYSLSDDPIMVPIGPGGTGAWLDTPPADISTVRSIRLDFGSRVFLPGESATLIIDMIGTADAPIDTTCFNAVRYIASAIIGGMHEPYLPAYSPPAYARVTMTEGTNAIGDYVWSDLNHNGIQDSGEPGLNGITVELYNELGILEQTTVSADSPIDGRPGFYMFSGVMDGNYRVRFDPAPLSGETLTIQHAGSDPNRDSDPDPITGLTDYVSLYNSTVRTDIDAGYFLPGPCQDELCQAITDLIESVALEEAALSHILNAEGEKLQAYLALSDQTPESVIKINNSVKKMVDSIAQLEMVLQAKIGLTQR